MVAGASNKHMRTFTTQNGTWKSNVKNNNQAMTLDELHVQANQMRLSSNHTTSPKSRDQTTQAVSTRMRKSMNTDLKMEARLSAR